MLILLIAGLLAVATPPPGADSWQGVWVGESASEVVAGNGEPLLRRQLPDGEILTWNRLSNPDAYMIIIESSGSVRTIRVLATKADGSKADLTDPSGVKIGDSTDQLRTKRGPPKETYSQQDGSIVYEYDGSSDDVWGYDFYDNGLHAIMLTSAHEPPVGSATGPDPRDGSTIGKAFVIDALSEVEGIRFERYYASEYSGCGQIVEQATSSHSGLQYDRLDLKCADGSTRSLFFDITSFFGKL